MAPIGFIGLGIMGEGMAARLLSQGIAGTEESPLVVWNRTPFKCTALAEKFADKKVVIKSTAREVIEACAVTYSILSTPEASKAVFEMEGDGVLAGMSEGKAIVDCATLAEADMQRMNEAVVAKGGYVLFLSCCGAVVQLQTAAVVRIENVPRQVLKDLR
jgi:3-hydroxyisobutyrate dehydrogenase-like beta-hydroxyacid dehydrogenase